MHKKIFLFADGTGNAYSTQESSVWRLYQALDTSSNNVVAKYIAGVGTSSFKPWSMFDAATGIGVPANVRDLYDFLCDEYAPGSEIFMFGFSRGAFTIRTLIGLIASEGLVSTKQYNASGALTSCPVTELAKFKIAAWYNYRAKVANSWPWWQRPPLVDIVRAFRKARQYFRISRYDTPHTIKVDIKFVGLFDSVEAYGVPIEEMRIAIDRVFWPISFRNSKMSQVALNVRHALSLDDERTSFHPLRIQAADDEEPEHARERIREVWFVGVHSDVGGGYPDGNLSYVPLIWMIDELEEMDEAVYFRQEQVKYWRERKTPYAPRHDSRSTLGVLYRYAPRNALMTETNGELIGPVIHHTVVERMAFGYDVYAPIPLSTHAKVLLPNGEICGITSAKDELPKDISSKFETSNEEVFKALRTLDGPNQELIEKAHDKIWCRRVGYFGMLAGLGSFILLPFYARPMSDWLCENLGQLYPISLWLDFWQGVGRSLSPIIGAIVPNVAGYFGPHLTTMREHPAMFFSMIAFLIWLYIRGVSIAKEIVELIDQAWMRGSDESQSHNGQKKEILVRKLRENWVIQFVHQSGASVVMPVLWAVILIMSTVTIGLRLNYEFITGTNWNKLCAATKDLRHVTGNDSVEALSKFTTNNPCWASGLEVEKDQTYRINLKIEDPWLDQTILTDARGFEPTLSFTDWPFLITRPYLRWALDPWFRPIIRIIGKYGDEESPIKFSETLKPSLFVDGKCPGVARRYDHSYEYCQSHGYITDDQCNKNALNLGIKPLPPSELQTAKLAFDNALDLHIEAKGCIKSRAMRIFTANITPTRTGELFMFVNDIIPLFGSYAPFYENNLGTATITLQEMKALNDQ